MAVLGDEHGTIQDCAPMPTVMNVVGARPQFVKAGPVSKALADAGMREVLVNTGQHYDDLMADAIMADVGLRQPDMDLSVGSGSHGLQTARILERVEAVIEDLGPDVVLTYGDTNSTIAAALAAAKLHVFTGHVEAGLRSFNRRMPEELNRVATDHISDLLLAPTEGALQQLIAEGLTERSRLVGDVMVDALMSIDLESIELPDWAASPFYAMTLHRPSNTDDATRLHQIFEAVSRLPHPVHLLAHPRLQQRIEDFRTPTGRVRVRPPVPYSTMLRLVASSEGLLTDSGGLQKEAFILGVKCTTLREETEWTETLAGGWNVLAGDRLDELSELVGRTATPVEGSPFGDGEAARSIVEEIGRHI